MSKITLRTALFALFMAVVPGMFGQVSTGTPPFGSFSSGPDVINLGNLNSHFMVPVFSKPGRGLSFTYNLSLDSSIWYPVGAVGAQTWTPVSNWGWRAQTEVALGYLSYSVGMTKCFDDPPGWYWGSRYGGFVYHDNLGATHAFTVTFTTCILDNHAHSGTAVDGSGLTIDADSKTITTTAGEVITPPVNTGVGLGTAKDRNGNMISAGASSFTDTLGLTVLSISGAAPSPVNLTYTDSTGVSRSVVVNYQTVTIKTNFGCSGISEYGPATVSLISHIDFPDGSSYSFSYEATPGFPGDVTGRVASITLKTGGTISYAYTGGSNGIVCVDGSTAGITRTTSDGITTYIRSGASPAWTTTVLDAATPTHNQTTINFQQVGAGYYETHRTIYQGTSTVLEQIDTCYNGTTPPNCNATPTLPYTQMQTYVTLDNGQRSLTRVNFNNFGLPTEEDDYDFGTSSNTLLKQTIITYNTTLGQIVDHPANITIKDGAGNQVAQTTFGYDETTPSPTTGVPQHGAAGFHRGNLTTLNQWLNTTSSYLTTRFTYDDTGNLLSVTDPGGHGTSFSYADNFSDAINRNSLAYVTQVTLPDTTSPGLAHHVGHMQYEPNTGRPSKATDQNGKDITFTYDLLVRPLQTNFPDGGQITMVYDSPNQVHSQTKIDSGGRIAYSYAALDAYGRVARTAKSNGESLPYDQQDFCYNSNGQLGFQSYPYQNTGFNVSEVCSGAGDSFSYDALGRPTQITHSDGTHAQATYSGRAQQIGDEGNGSFNVTRILQKNALGQIMSVCEVSSAGLLGSGGTPAGCGQDIAATGFLTSYAYDTLGNLTSVTQGSVTARTFAYDSLSRLTSQSQPEWGAGSTMTYGYNSDSLMTSRIRPAPNQTNPAVTVTTNYAYDALHRLISRTYTGDPSGTPSAVLNYDEAVVWSNNLSNTLGRLSSESSGSTGQVFSYDPMGRVLSNWQCTPRNCGGTPYLLSYGYDLAGDMTSAGNGAGVTFTYAYNTAPRLTTVTSSLADAQHPGTLLSNVHYGPFGQVSDTLGNGINETFAYNARGMVQSYASLPSVYSFTLTGLAGDGNITAANDSANGNWTYTYDQFNRLASSSKSTAPLQAFSYDYDRYGNRWHQNVTQGSGPATQYAMDNATNRISGSGVQYDALGNELTDGLGNTYTYDAENRLITVVNGGGTYNYTYDADGRRVKNATYEFIYDLAGRPASQFLSSNGVPSHERVYAGVRHFASYSGATTNFVHVDWVGTKRVMTSVSGTNSETCTSLPFGDASSCTGTDWDFNHYTDDLHDSESNLEHTWFRQLSTTQGRWMRPDPYLGSIDLTEPQSLNRYIYVLNNPLGLVDPDGLDCVFLNDDGTAFEEVDADSNTSQGECEDNGGYYVPGTVTGFTTGDDGSVTGIIYNPFPGSGSSCDICGLGIGPTDNNPDGPGGNGNSGGGGGGGGVVQGIQNFLNACGGRFSGILAVSDALGYVGVAGAAVNGIASLTNSASSALTSNATQLAGKLGESSGLSAAEVLAHGGGSGASAAVTIAQDISLAGKITGQVGSLLGVVGKVSGAVGLAGTAASLAIRAGCAAGLI